MDAIWQFQWWLPTEKSPPTKSEPNGTQLQNVQHYFRNHEWASRIQKETRFAQKWTHWNQNI